MKCGTTFESEIGILKLTMIKAVHAHFWQSESPERTQTENRASPVKLDLKVRGHPVALFPSK